MSRNNKRTVKTSRSAIFEYWKDKAKRDRHIQS